MLRIGVLGSGGISHAHADGYLDPVNLSRARVVAVSDVLPVAAKSLASRFGPDVNTYGDFHELLEKEELDAVDICLPHNLHADAIVVGARACRQDLRGYHKRELFCPSHRGLEGKKGRNGRRGDDRHRLSCHI